MNGSSDEGSWVDLLLRRSPAQPILRRRTARRLVVLAYHGVTDPVRFEDQLVTLGRYAAFISGRQFCEALDDCGGLPRFPVLLTFDDGDPSIHDQGLPILRRLGIPAVAFVVAGLIGSDRAYWWEEVESLVERGATCPRIPGGSGADAVRWLKKLDNDVRLEAIEALRASVGAEAARSRQLTRAELLEMSASGVEIGNHTFSHPCLNRCDPSTAESEVRNAHRTLSQMLGTEPRLFAYPNGDPHPVVPNVLRSLGYRAAFLFDHRLAGCPPADRFAVSRVRVNSWTPLDRFRTIVSGLHPFIHHLRGRS